MKKEHWCEDCFDFVSDVATDSGLCKMHHDRKKIVNEKRRKFNWRQSRDSERNTHSTQKNDAQEDSKQLVRDNFDYEKKIRIKQPNLHSGLFSCGGCGDLIHAHNTTCVYQYCNHCGERRVYYPKYTKVEDEI